MLLSYTELVELVEQGIVTAPLDQVNAASIDLTLGDEMLVEMKSRVERVVDLADKRDELPMEIRSLRSNFLILAPGQFALAHTREVFNLPADIAGQFFLKSSIARRGLNHLLAGWMDPGWHGSTLTLELHNTLLHHSLMLQAGMKIGQAVFHRVRPVPDHASYATVGRYNHQSAPTPSKGVA